MSLTDPARDTTGDQSDVYGADIFTEPDGDPDTLTNLGPLAPLAGSWRGTKGVDRHPEVDGPETEPFVEHYRLDPIDRQTNGPQLFYGLRYHTFITRPGEIETFHDQVGHWLWEPEANLVTMTLSIPRGQVLLAAGEAETDATSFTVHASAGHPNYAIASNPFLERAFRTVSFEMTIMTGPGDEWSYDQETILMVEGSKEPFSHTDHNTLKRIAPAVMNPLGGARLEHGSLGIGDLRTKGMSTL